MNDNIDLSQGIIINPVARFDYTTEDRDAFIAWWKETAFPALKEEFAGLKWTDGENPWVLVIVDPQLDNFMVRILAPAAQRGQEPFFLEPTEENLKLIGDAVRASRALHYASRGREAPKPNGTGVPS